MFCHQFLAVFENESVNGLAQNDSRVTPFLDDSSDEGLLDNEGVVPRKLSSACTKSYMSMSPNE